MDQNKLIQRLLRHLFLLITLVFTANTYAGGVYNISATGQFSNDDDIMLFEFFLFGADREVTFMTLGYAGGIMQNGNAVTSGGFDPYLSLFDKKGNLIAQNDDGDGVAFDPDSFVQKAFDSKIIATLSEGSYTLALTQYSNTPVGSTFSDGFAKEGESNFTMFRGCSNGEFCDVYAENRNSNWALDITNLFAVPVPSAVWLFGSALLGLFGLQRKRI